MAASTLEHETLGNRHKQYNELLGKVLKGETIIKLEDINFDKNDQDNLLMIDIASEKKDVDYILSILKSEDMLYVSRALQKCVWLFNDDQYSHIINPHYLNDQLLPEMTTKASNKLIKCIRHNLTDEPRVEQFYIHEKRIKEALKWLPNCSIPFIEEKVKQYANELEAKTFKRLCERSITVFEIVAEKDNCSLLFSKYSMFLLTTHTEKYLDILDKTKYYSPKFNAKTTTFLMKRAPDRITKNFEKYVKFIDIATFAKYIKKENIKDFLLEQANKNLCDRENYYLRNFLKSPEIAYLIERIPREERFDFVKKVFIDTVIDPEDNIIPLDSLRSRMQNLSKAVRLEKHQWYKFAPFHIAFEEITKMIKVETVHDKKYSMLFTLLNCVDKNEKDLQTLLQYYVSNHINDEHRLKNQFVNNLIKHSKVYKYDKKSWEILNEIFKTMDVYVDKDHDVQDCIILIILYNSLNNEGVPGIIMKKFSFDTLKYYRNKLNNQEQEKVFTFLYNYLVANIQNQNITTETEFMEITKTLGKIMNLLKDWNKELMNFPFVVNKIKDITAIKQQNSWKTSLSILYNLKKSWRKHMFEESLVLSPSQEVCVNALKHDPGLLMRYNEIVKQLCSDDKISMKLLHSKLRIYWPESLGKDWANAYRERLNVLGGHKSLIRGLCYLVPEKSLIDIIKSYAPKEAKINWSEIDELTLSLQRYIAKNMHFARPQIHPNAVLWYAKGDYLQYALPSLLAVFYNMKLDLSREFIPKLLDAPVSVQKHGIRFAFLRLELTNLKTIFLHIWNSSKNLSIRAELFKHTFKLLCNSKENAAKVEEVYILLELFIDNLTHTDEAKIFDMLVRINEVPSFIQAKFLIKCYNAFKRLLHLFNADRIKCYERYMRTLAEHSRDVMESIDKEFVAQIILEYLDKELFNFEGKKADRVSDYDGMVKVVSAYLLCTMDIEQQEKRYEIILAPVIKRLLTIETNVRRESNNLENFATLLSRLYKDLKEYVMDQNVIIPYKMFCRIQEELKPLPLQENYKMVTMWKLTTIYTKLLNENDTTCKWAEITMKLAPDFANICRSYLKEEVTTRFPCIYVIFSRVLNELLNQMPFEACCKIYEIMLEDKDFVQAFLAVITMLPNNQYLETCEQQKYDELHKILLEPCVPEIKMHYYSRFEKYLRCH